MTASAKRRADKRRAAERAAGRCCSQIVCGCPEPAGPSPDRRSLDARLRTALAQAPPRARTRHR